ncbi:hypothetical protein Patl1_32875 [Pistacia atlantica]|uniref:Uncharacterized protein n=1 Tax=Pistacia atlantica TaxID=434234 RepID=A0ACC1AQF2_9ROSI|nr:hypothetical protein Patl1_32875 [Pistacia atlantica]
MRHTLLYEDRLCSFILYQLSKRHIHFYVKKKSSEVSLKQREIENLFIALIVKALLTLWIDVISSMGFLLDTNCMAKMFSHPIEAEKPLLTKLIHNSFQTHTSLSLILLLNSLLRNLLKSKPLLMVKNLSKQTIQVFRPPSVLPLLHKRQT